MIYVIIRVIIIGYKDYSVLIFFLEICGLFFEQDQCSGTNSQGKGYQATFLQCQNTRSLSSFPQDISTSEKSDIYQVDK